MAAFFRRSGVGGYRRRRERQRAEGDVGGCGGHSWRIVCAYRVRSGGKGLLFEERQGVEVLIGPTLSGMRIPMVEEYSCSQVDQITGSRGQFGKLGLSDSNIPLLVVLLHACP